MNINKLEEKTGYCFRNKALLYKALTHASKSTEHLERHEFLGDAVLGLVIANFLYQQYPNSPEGELSKMRANLVCKQALLQIAQDWQLADYLIVGDGERDKQGRLKSESIAANAVEAVIGAVFEDTGYQQAEALVLSAWQTSLQQVQPINLRDAKSELQELTQSYALGLPLYQIQDMGAQAIPRFEASCLLKGEVLGKGKGQRKKDAETKAAKQALASHVLQQMLKK